MSMPTQKPFYCAMGGPSKLRVRRIRSFDCGRAHCTATQPRSLTSASLHQATANLDCSSLERLTCRPLPYKFFPRFIETSKNPSHPPNLRFLVAPSPSLPLPRAFLHHGGSNTTTSARLTRLWTNRPFASKAAFRVDRAVG